jgi:hypothetical protein
LTKTGSAPRYGSSVIAGWCRINPRRRSGRRSRWGDARVGRRDESTACPACWLWLWESQDCSRATSMLRRASLRHSGCSRTRRITASPSACTSPFSFGKSFVKSHHIDVYCSYCSADRSAVFVYG